jgi:hypothetical protein
MLREFKTRYLLPAAIGDAGNQASSGLVTSRVSSCGTNPSPGDQEPLIRKSSIARERMICRDALQPDSGSDIPGSVKWLSHSIRLLCAIHVH